MTNIDNLADEKTDHVDESEQFYDERLLQHGRDEWPSRIDRAALDVLFGVAIGSSDNQDDIGGTIGKVNFGDATGKHYVRGLTELADEQSDLPQLIEQYERANGATSIGDLVFRLNELRFELERHLESDDDIRNLNRAVEALIDKIATASVSTDVTRQAFQRPESVTDAMIQLFSDPATAEYADVLMETMHDIAQTETFLERLDAPHMTTPLWDHQRDALRAWVEHGCKGYVDMATATGKTVLGLAAVAMLHGQLHPDDATTIFAEHEDATLENGGYDRYLPLETRDGDARVLVVAGQELILEQWQSEFDEHLNIPRERTRTDGNTMQFTWGSIEFRTAPDLLQMETLGGYDLVVLDEAHQYKRGGRSGGWRTVLEELAQKSAAVLAMSGSIDTSWQGDSAVKRMLEEHLHECKRFSVDEAREAGVVADFEWDVYYAHAAESRSQEGVVESTASIRDVYDVEQHKIRVDEIDENVPADVPPTFETLTDLRSFSQSKTGASAREASDAFDKLATDAFTRRPKRWQLFPPIETLVELVGRHAPEQQCVVLVQSYEQAEQVGEALEDRYGSELVLMPDSDASEQFTQISTFKERDRGIIVGPAHVLGTGVDLPNAEVAINLSKGGVNASLIQRIGRVLRNPTGEKAAIFYHIVTLPSDPRGLLPGEDGRRLLRRASEFRALGARLRQLPGYDSSNEDTAATLATLERRGADAVTQDDRSIEDIVEDEVAQAFLQTLREMIVSTDDSESNQPILTTFSGSAIDRQARPVAEAVKNHQPTNSPETTTDPSDQEQPPDGTQSSLSATTSGEPDDLVDLEQLEELVDKYTGSPAGMGKALRKRVDDGEIPKVVDNDLGGVSPSNRDQVLDQLDELLPEFEFGEYPDDTKNGESSGSDKGQKSSDSSPKRCQSASADVEEDGGDRTATRSESTSSDGETATIELSPELATLLELVVATDSRSERSREELVDNALEAFLTSTVGAELQPAAFNITDEIEVSVDCDPVLDQALDLFILTDDDIETRGDLVATAIAEHIGITETQTQLEIAEFDRYQVIVDALVENDDCPCETQDEVVQAAIETYLDV